MPDVQPDLEVLPPSEQLLENMINVNYNLIVVMVGRGDFLKVKGKTK